MEITICNCNLQIVKSKLWFLFSFWFLFDGKIQNRKDLAWLANSLCVVLSRANNQNKEKYHAIV